MEGEGREGGREGGQEGGRRGKGDLSTKTWGLEFFKIHFF